MNDKVTLADLLSLEIMQSGCVTIEHSGGILSLHFEFERGGELLQGGLKFDSVRGFRYRSEGHCTAWHLEGVYDTLAEILNSAWISELRNAEPSGTPWLRPIRHFMIYFDDTGCYEIAAESWSWLPEAMNKDASN